MEEMEKYYYHYMKQNRGKVKFDADPKMTSYSFEVEQLDGKRYVVMKSWFWEMK